MTREEGAEAEGAAERGGRRAEAEASVGEDDGDDEVAEQPAEGAEAGAASGGVAGDDVEAPASFFREGLESAREAGGEFLRGFRAAGDRSPLAARVGTALAIGLGLSYSYEYVVVVVAALTGQAEGAVREALTVEVSTQALLLFLAVLVYADLFVSVVALNRLRRGPPPRQRGLEGERGRQRGADLDLSRAWWLVNLGIGAAAGYVLLASFGPFVAGVGASLGLLGGDELYRRARGNNR